MCDTVIPACCVANSTSTKEGCIANGGKIDTNPCNILNPVATPGGCASNKAATTVASAGLPQWEIVTIAISIIVVFIIVVTVFIYSNNVQVFSGGRRGFNLFGNLKKLRW